jgi:hypothetical protein
MEKTLPVIEDKKVIVYLVHPTAKEFDEKMKKLAFQAFTDKSGRLFNSLKRVVQVAISVCSDVLLQAHLKVLFASIDYLAVCYLTVIAKKEIPQENIEIDVFSQEEENRLVNMLLGSQGLVFISHLQVFANTIMGQPNELFQTIALNFDVWRYNYILLLPYCISQVSIEVDKEGYIQYFGNSSTLIQAFKNLVNESTFVQNVEQAEKTEKTEKT